MIGLIYGAGDVRPQAKNMKSLVIVAGCKVFGSDKSRLSLHLIVVVNKGNYYCGKDVDSYNNATMKLYYKHCPTV